LTWRKSGLLWFLEGLECVGGVLRGEERRGEERRGEEEGKGCMMK
jgi:hypothetical protein